MDRIVYIDESADTTHRFQRRAHGKFEVAVVKPQPDLYECLAEIWELEPDAVVSDFNLKEHDPTIPYSGANLVDEFLETRAGFPCFILTSYEDEATTASEDVNLVYPRSYLSRDTADVSFFDKVSRQIAHYRERLAKCADEHTTLLHLSEERELNAEETEKLIELDTFLERAADARVAKPKHLKDGEAFGRWGGLLSEADKLIVKLREAREADG